MGREARTTCRWNGGSGEVRALLETSELILRGAFQARYALADLTNIRVEGVSLVFTAGDGDIALALGAKPAASWAKKMLAPPPSLADKLGLSPNSKAWLIGTTDSPELISALHGHETAAREEIRLSLAVTGDAAELRAALTWHEKLPAGTPIWIVHGKGAGTDFGEAPVRTLMRKAGYRDNKACAISEKLSATRYARGKSQE
ncbi:hypothetical protein [Labrys neptuniae]